MEQFKQNVVAFIEAESKGWMEAADRAQGTMSTVLRGKACAVFDIAKQVAALQLESLCPRRRGTRKAKMTAAKTRTIPQSLAPKTTYEADGWVVSFLPVDDVPGFSHRVHLKYEGEFVARDWLGKTTKPSAKAALFYVTKHA